MVTPTMALDRETIITLGAALPPAIGIFGRLEGLLQQPDTDLDEIVALVRVDPALTFQIIRLGNSAYYGLKHHCDSLDEAVARIGFRDIHHLVGLVAARHAAQQDLRSYQIPALRFWENSVATGQVMTALATRNGVDSRKAYATGLLRNLGRVVLNNYSGAQRYPGPTAAPSLPAWEMAAYGISAAEVGAQLLAHWRFAPDTVAAIRAHVEPAVVTEPFFSAAMLHLAAAVVDGWGYGLPGEQTIWRPDAAMLERAGLSASAMAEVIAEARTAFARIAGIKWAAAA